MSNNRLNTEGETLELGIKQLLGKVPYEVHEHAYECVHEDDGHIYSKSMTKMILRCSICGEYYEEVIH